MLAWCSVAAVALLLLACGDDDAPADVDGGVTIDAPEAADAAGCVPGPDAAAGAPGSVTGSWAVLQLSTAVSTSFNAEQISRNVHLYEMVEDEAGAVTIRDRLCDLQVKDSNIDLTTSLRPKAIASVPVLSRTGMSAGNDFTTDMAYTQRGVLLEDVVNDALPTSGDDPRLVDGEEDGHPGITLFLSGTLSGAIYVAQRDWNAYTAVQVDADHIRGTADWGSEQEAYGADPEDFLDFDLDVVRAPGDEKHPVILVRVPDGEGCAYVLANQCQLFGGK